jgi:hypothetical protein
MPLQSWLLALAEALARQIKIPQTSKATPTMKAIVILEWSSDLGNFTAGLQTTRGYPGLQL